MRNFVTVYPKTSYLERYYDGHVKTYLASAFGHQACRYDFSVSYKQTSRLLQELVISKGDGRYFSLLGKLAKTNLLILDDWGLDTPTAEQRRVLLEVLDDRYERGSTLIASQLPISLWYENLNDSTCSYCLHF